MLQTCTRCVMDTSAHITFDAAGECNFCHAYDKYVAEVNASDRYNPQILHEKIQIMKDAAKGKKYDCIIGLSGGLDSSYLCHLMHSWGVRALLVHADNGWNSKLAEYNIKCIVDKTGFDFERVVLDFNEFKELQKAYFRASVCDVEVLTDHAMMAVLYQQAEKHGLRYSVIGSNYTTEFIYPKGWNYDKTDITNIKAICEKYSSVPIKTFPVYGAFSRQSQFINIAPLYYENYNKKKAAAILQREYGWKPYPYKHYESIFTCFYQAFYLPTKFGIDKRRMHFSDLIHSGQMTRNEALADLAKPACSGAALAQMKAQVLSKLGFTEEEWQEIMDAPPVAHSAFPTTPEILKIGKQIKAALKTR